MVFHTIIWYGEVTSVNVNFCKFQISVQYRNHSLHFRKFIKFLKQAFSRDRWKSRWKWSCLKNRVCKKRVETRTGLNVGLCIPWHGQSATPGATFPTLCEKCVGSLTSLLTISEKRKETGPTAYRSYPKRTVVKAKVGTFSSIFYDPECWPGLELEPSTSSAPVERSKTWANQARLVKVSKEDSISFIMITFLFVFLQEIFWELYFHT